MQINLFCYLYSKKYIVSMIWSLNFTNVWHIQILYVYVKEMNKVHILHFTFSTDHLTLRFYYELFVHEATNVKVCNYGRFKS